MLLYLFLTLRISSIQVCFLVYSVSYADDPGVQYGITYGRLLVAVWMTLGSLPLLMSLSVWSILTLGSV